MATFIEERKKQRRLLYILFTSLIITAIVLWWGFWRKPAPVIEQVKTGNLEFLKPVEIDMTLLENPILRALEPFEGLSPFEGGRGRENPFIPY